MFIGESVIRHRRINAGTDEWNVPAYAWTTQPLTCLGFAPGGSEEPTRVGVASVANRAAIYFDGAVDVVATDRLEVRGVVWEVDGDPQTWHSPFTGRASTVVYLKYVRKDAPDAV